MNVTHAHQALAEAFQYAIEELDGLIARHFANERHLTITRDHDRYHIRIDDNTELWRGESKERALGWLRAFLSEPEHANVRVHGMADLLVGHSVRVADTVVALPVRAEA